METKTINKSLNLTGKFTLDYMVTANYGKVTKNPEHYTGLNLSDEPWEKCYMLVDYFEKNQFAILKNLYGDVKGIKKYHFTKKNPYVFKQLDLPFYLVSKVDS